MRDGRRLQSRFESRKTTVLEMRWGTWALWHWSLMIDENFPKTYYEVMKLWRDITVNACIIDFTKPQIWAMVNQCAKTNLVPDCKPPAIAAKQRTTVGKVLCYCKYYKPLFRRLWKLSLHQSSIFPSAGGVGGNPREQNEEKMSWCSTRTPGFIDVFTQ